MGAAELTKDRVIPSDASRAAQRLAGADICRVAVIYGALWALTALGGLLGRLLPALAPGGRPHPSLHGTLGDFAAIAATNARTLSASFLLAALRFPTERRSRTLGDVIVLGLLAGNALRVGLALGRDGGGLVPYVPQLPVEWLAAAVAGGAWLTLRHHPETRTALVYVAAVLALVAMSAAIETLATPHAIARDAMGQGQATANRDSAPIHRPGPCAAGRGWFACAGSCAGAGSHFNVASLPSPRSRSVPLGRLAGAAGLRQPPPDPARRDQE